MNTGAEWDDSDYEQAMAQREADDAVAHAKDRYTAAVETGSCCGPHDQYHPVPDGGCRWEERATCGHLHKTREAADACGTRNQHWSKDGQTCSALWYNYTIHNQHGQRA